MNAMPSPALASAFTCSGMIRAEHNDLERHRRELLIAPLEDQLLAAWAAERGVSRETRHNVVCDQTRSQQYNAGLISGHLAAMAAERRKNAVLSELAKGPKRRADLMKAAGLKDHALGNLLSRLRKEGRITMTRSQGHVYIYEAAK